MVNGLSLGVFLLILSVSFWSSVALTIAIPWFCLVLLCHQIFYFLPITVFLIIMTPTTDLSNAMDIFHFLYKDSIDIHSTDPYVMTGWTSQLKSSCINTGESLSVCHLHWLLKVLIVKGKHTVSSMAVCSIWTWLLNTV